MKTPMTANEIVRALIQGSKNIDRMKEEITQVVKMIIGLCEDLRPNAVIDYVIPSAICNWYVVGDINEQLRIKCRFPTADWCVFVQLPSTCVFSNRLEVVQLVHEALPDFVHGMFKQFPGLAEKCKPFIEASKVRFPE